MTTVEAGVAVGQPYAKHEERSIAIHEAGHAVCSHLYTENLLSTRLSVRKRGDSGGHHQAMRDRGPLRRLALRAGRRPDPHASARWRPSTSSTGQNTTGVGGDVYSVTAHAVRHGRPSRRWRPRRSTSPTASRTPSAREEEEERITRALRRSSARRSCTAPAAA